jgi:hypothetical protein
MFAIVLVQKVPSFSLLSLKMGFAADSVIANILPEIPQFTQRPNPNFAFRRGTINRARQITWRDAAPSTSHNRRASRGVRRLAAAVCRPGLPGRAATTSHKSRSWFDARLLTGHPPRRAVEGRGL